MRPRLPAATPQETQASEQASLIRLQEVQDELSQRTRFMQLAQGTRRSLLTGQPLRGISIVR